MKKPGKPPDMEEPLIMRGIIQVRDVCGKINLLEHFKYARLWGPTARFPGQKVGLQQKLKDQDIVEVHD